MHLRELRIDDAPLMLEWMHDDSVVRDLYADFASKTIEDCREFIINSRQPDVMHMAIASDTDEYMGTVSLKYIDKDQHNAEFAITVRSVAMGHGYSWFGMQEMLKKAFEEDLEAVYWCVSRDNARAVRFYDKHNFHETVDIPSEIQQRYSDTANLKWYSMLKGDVFDDRESVAGCKVIHITTIPTVDSGELSFFEEFNDLPFDIKRVYYISKVPEGKRRGYHAHKSLKQMLFCPYGKIQLVLENEFGREELELSDPSIGVVIDRPTWREMLWIQKDSVLCVAASDYYDPDDYIRDYDKYRDYIKSKKGE